MIRFDIALAWVAAVAGVLSGLVLALALVVPPAHAAGGSQWTGCYVGAGGAYSMADTKTSAEAGGVSFVTVDGLGMQGVGLYGQVGCDVELMPRWVVGAWGDYTWDNNADFKVSAFGAPGDLLKASLKDSWGVGGRAGYLVTDKALVYVLAGYTQADLSNVTGLMVMPSLSTPALKGYVLGAGVDLALRDGWFAEAQASYAKYDKANIDLGGGDLIGLETDVLSARVGLQYKFNWTDVPAKPLK
jgi:outer membrane immunogenic protein